MVDVPEAFRCKIMCKYVQTSRECPNMIKFTENYMQNPSNNSKSFF
jgi:hypothetical protein